MLQVLFWVVVSLMGIAGFALGAIDAYFEFQEIQLAHFIAKAQRVIDDQLVDTAWPIQWHGSLQDKQEIFKDSQGILDIASRSWSIRRKEPIIRFHTARQSHWSTFEAGSETNSFDLSPSDTTVEIEVTILADPELRTPFRKRYTLNLTDDEITLGATVAVSL